MDPTVHNNGKKQLPPTTPKWISSPGNPLKGDLHRAVFTPPHLSYSFNALEPIADYDTLKNHFYNFHMKGFEEFLDLINDTEVEKIGLGLLFKHSDRYPEDVIEHAGCVFNHQLYWDNLSPHGGSMSEEFESVVNQNFGSVFQLKMNLFNLAQSHDCCGWLWLIVTHDGKLQLTGTKHNLNPLMKGASHPGTPLLAIDMWEHAYYVKFQNNREDYLRSIWMLINWNEVSRRYNFAT
ncbi:MAG: superoxide dismutase [Bacteroidales bacterium]|nr:superoxide dismutase [Bacteroidales bacterium]